MGKRLTEKAADISDDCGRISMGIGCTLWGFVLIHSAIYLLETGKLNEFLGFMFGVGSR